MNAPWIGTEWCGCGLCSMRRKATLSRWQRLVLFVLKGLR